MPCPEPAALPVAASEMSGADVVDAEAEQQIHITKVVSNPELCQLVDSADIVTTDSDVAVSKWLQTLINTYSILGEVHNMHVVVDAINQLAPTTDWVHVMEDEGFSIPDESTVSLKRSICTRVYKEEPVPLNVICPSLWKNAEGQNRLMRFVDLCEELKIISGVLDCTPLPFSIKLAIAASKKGHSLIDKWLSAKSDKYKACFLEECANFLKCHISNLLKDQQFSKDLIFQEKQKIFELKGQILEYPFDCWRPEDFEKEYGPVIRRLKALTKSNDETLKYLMKVLQKVFNGGALLRQLDAIFDRNKAASKNAGPLIFEYHDYLRRANIEQAWIVGAKGRVDQVYGLLSGGSTVVAELDDLESHICDLNRRMTLLSKQCAQNFHSHCQDLDTLAKLYEDIEILSKRLPLVTEVADDLCLRSKNLRVLLSEKIVNADRFHITEQHLQEEKESSKMCQNLLDLQHKVEQARVSCKKKMAGLPEVSDTAANCEQILVEHALSWRTRRYLGMNIMGEMRTQGLEMCAFVSTVVMRESLGKREDARDCIRYGRRYKPRKHIKLSEQHLQDIFIAFSAKNKRRGREKLDVCMERMREVGVVSDYEYNIAEGEEMGFWRFHISSFEKMDPGHFDEAFRKLDDGIVLVGTFGITKGYFSLGPDDLYDVQKDAILETGPSGNNLTHAVVIVGYGMSPEGIPYYAYQNWYGPNWGKDGYGMVTCGSIRQLYSAQV